VTWAARGGALSLGASLVGVVRMVWMRSGPASPWALAAHTDNAVTRAVRQSTRHAQVRSAVAKAEPRERRRPGRKQGLRTIRMLLAVSLALVSLLVGAMTAGAQYDSVRSPYKQFLWASIQSGTGLSDVAIRSDDYAIVSIIANNAADDGYLHLLSPWDRTIDASNRFGPLIHPCGVVAMDNTLYVPGAPDSSPSSPHYGLVPLYQMDDQSGAIRRVVVWLDPRACYSFGAEGSTGKLLAGGHEQGSSGLDIDEIDVSTGAVTPLIRNITNAVTEGLWASPSGDQIWVGEDSPSDIAAYARSGQLEYVIGAPTSPDGVGVPTSGCFAGSLYYTDDAANVYQVQIPNTASVPLAATSRQPTSQPNVAKITWDPAGNLVVLFYNELVVIACPDYQWPAPPDHHDKGGQSNPNTSGPSNQPAAPGNGSTSGGQPANHSALTGPGAPAAPALQPAQATQAQTTTASQAAQQPMAGVNSASQAAGQAASVPNTVGVVDVPDQHPVMGMTAVAADPPTGTPVYVPIAVGMASLGAWTCACTRQRPRGHSVRPAHVVSNNRYDA